MEFLNNGPFYLLNKLIYIVDANGNAKFVYHMGVGIAGILCMVVALLLCKKYGLSFWKALAVQVVSFPAAYGLAIVLTYFETGMMRFGGANVIRAYPFYPLLYWLIAKLFRIDSRDMLDWEVVPNSLSKPLAHLFCIFAGCCYGRECSWGIYNAKLKTFLFPIQSLEVVVGFGVVAFAAIMMRKHNYHTQGTGFAKLMIIEGIVRFGCELLRDNTKLFWYISDMALYALAMIVIGIVWLSIYRKKNQLQWRDVLS